MRNITDVKVFLRENDPIWFWVIPACPNCGEEHTHYGGMLTDDPRDHLGPRTYLCRGIPIDDSMPEYNLVEADPAGTDRIIKGARQAAA